VIHQQTLDASVCSVLFLLIRTTKVQKTELITNWFG